MNGFAVVMGGHGCSWNVQRVKLEVDTLLSCGSAAKIFVHRSIGGNTDRFRFHFVLATLRTGPTK